MEVHSVTPADAHRIEGFLRAIARLKDDGTLFQCIYLGDGDPSWMAATVEEKFRFDSPVTLVSEQASWRATTRAGGLDCARSSR
jgi:hypothetical protein